MEDMGGEEILNVFSSRPFITRLSPMSVGGGGGVGEGGNVVGTGGGAIVVHLAGTAIRYYYYYCWLIGQSERGTATDNKSRHLSVNSTTTNINNISSSRADQQDIIAD